MQQQMIKVWDWPLRLCHVLLALAVIGALVSVNIGGNAMIWHQRFGLLALACVLFRVQWGLVGSYHARFISFPPWPPAIVAYLRGRWQGLGHNPLGAWSVYALLLVILLQALMGLFSHDDIAFRGALAPLLDSDWSDQLSSWHRQLEPVIFALIGLHLLAVTGYTLAGKGLLLPMLHGRKKASDAQLDFLQQAAGDIERSQQWQWSRLLLVLGMTVLLVWLASGALVPAAVPTAPAIEDLGW